MQTVERRRPHLVVGRRLLALPLRQLTREELIALLGIDLARTSAALDTSGAVVLRRRVRRSALTAFIEKLSAASP